jgi:CheY-like chemotaxis protein
VNDDHHRGAVLGAFSYLENPVTRESIEAALVGISAFIARPVRLLLLVEDDPKDQMSVSELLGGGDVEIVTASTAQKALGLLDERAFDCMVVDLMLPDSDGLVLIERVRGDQRFASLPIIVYSGRDLSREELQRLQRHVVSTISKGDLDATERLLGDSAVFLHRLDSHLPDGARRRLGASFADSPLAGRRVLLVDDDARNVYAMTSFLESHGIDVLYADNGRSGLETLRANPDVDLVLMDIMMPEMDGYAAMRAIRADTGLRHIPIIAVTAKALRDDHERCMQAGASDYLPKPVDNDRLLEQIRLWTGPGLSAPPEVS